ncbi:MAG: carbohydrate-binding family 9-like protein [Armatimonadota bacterium]
MSKTEARVLWDDSYLYVAYRAYDKDVWSLLKDRDAQTCTEDCLECFIQPDPTRQTYYNFEINAAGAIYDSYNVGRNSGGYDHHRWAAWNCEGLRTGIAIDGTLNKWSDTDRYWQMELAIPFAELPSLNGKMPKVGDVWRFLLARYDYSVYLPDGVELSCCSHLKAVDFHTTSDWSRLRFAE